MVAHKDAVQDVKKMVGMLDAMGRTETQSHCAVYRPLGSYDSVDNGTRHQVKHITVKPGAQLSLQMHHHRAEHWIVVSGTAQVTCDDKVFCSRKTVDLYPHRLCASPEQPRQDSPGNHRGAVRQLPG